MSGLMSHSKNSIPVWFRLFWWAEELHALSYALLKQGMNILVITLAHVGGGYSTLCVCVCVCYHKIAV